MAHARFGRAFGVLVILVGRYARVVEKGLHRQECLRYGLAVFLGAAGPFSTAAYAQDHKTWRDYGGAADSAQYSVLAQINRSNVSKLEVAWTYPTSRGINYWESKNRSDRRLLFASNKLSFLDAFTCRVG